jgi:hypothetical protein
MHKRPILYENIRKALNNSQLSPEEKVKLMMEMTDTATAICIDGIKENNPNITEEELHAFLRERIKERRKD